MVDAGRIAPISRGNYDKDTTYVQLDVVSYNGSSYIARRTTVRFGPR